MNIAICDDDCRFRELLEKHIRNYFNEKSMVLNIIQFPSGEAILSEELLFDIVFLDIEMDELNGIETGKALKAKNPQSIIFIVTSHENYLDDALRINAFRFLSKPLDIVRLFNSLDDAVELLKNDLIAFYVWEASILKGLIITMDNTSASIPIIYDDSGTVQGYIGLTGTPYYYTRDGLGNIVNITSAIDDSISIVISYDAWGNPEYSTVGSGWGAIGTGIAAAIISILNPCSYQGYLFDSETGLYYCQSRYYSPKLCRFVNMDNENILSATQGEVLNANLFSYTDNNPVNNVDPLGLFSISSSSLCPSG